MTSINQYYVILEVDPSFQLGPNALSRIYAKSASWSTVPLSQLATITAIIISHRFAACNNAGKGYDPTTAARNEPDKKL